MVFFLFGVEAWSLGVFAADQAVFLKEIGIGSVDSSIALGAAAGVAAVSGILLTRISDRISPYYAIIGAFASMLIGAIAFLFATDITMVWVYSVFFGAGYGLFVPTLPVAITRYFGALEVSRALGIGAIVAGIMGGLGPYITARVVDTTGNMTIAIGIVTAMLGIGLVVAILARPPKYALKTVKKVDPTETVERTATTGAHLPADVEA